MRKLILISAFVLASVSAQASDSRSLILAANDVPAATATTPTTTAPAAKTEEAKPEAVAVEPAKPEAATKQASKSQHTAHARHTYEGDETKARRIAARYGVYW